MQKLIDSFRADPTPANRKRLQTYIAKHMMALCLATPDEIAFLKSNNFTL